MGRGQKRGREGGGGGFEDQYGDGMMSQDRGDRGPSGGGSGGGFRGGGSAGGGVKGRDVSVTRSVPKFLQKHIHLLGRKPVADADDSDDDEQLAAIADNRKQAGPPDEDSDDNDEREALEKAVMDDPELAKQFLELKDVANRVKANAAKEEGNREFAAKNYDKAVKHFSEAISLAPSAVFYSNRAAAYFSLKEFRLSAEDAKQVVILDKKWVKGWSRLGAALSAMEEWSEAKDAYTKAAELEPDDANLTSMLYKCETEESKLASEGKVKFKASRQKAAPKDRSRQKVDAKSEKGNRKQSALSFNADEADEGG